MEENIPPSVSLISALRQGSRGSTLFLTTLSKNGLAERKNGSIVEATKAMIHDQSLPMFLWAEASMTAVYVQNKSPHKILKNMTPEEAFT
jgi:hypothetical protein